MQPDGQGPRPDHDLRGHRRRRQGRQVHRLRRQAEHPDQPRLRQRRRDRPPGARHALPQGHRRRRQGRRAQGALHRLGHRRHPRRAEQPALRARQLDLRHRRLLRLQRHGRRRAASASARGSTASSRTARSSSSSAARTTTPGASASARRGSLFGSTANGCPSVYLPIPNRYYESVRGWSPTVLANIADSNRVLPDHRQGAPGRLARRLHRRGRPRPLHGPHLPEGVLEPHRVRRRADRAPGRHVHARTRTAATSRSHNGWNLLASDDEWTAPIMAEVGPDGNVWVIDWYNFIVQHNPTPPGFKTGKGNAYETPLRDKTHGRIYRIVAQGRQAGEPTDARSEGRPEGAGRGAQERQHVLAAARPAAAGRARQDATSCPT